MILCFLWIIPSPAYAWGPGMHFYLVRNLIEMGMITGATATIIRERKHWFYYGSVVADVVIGKGFLSYEHHSHNWQMARDLREASGNLREEAFTLGVWAHLAADTVAHNEFVPDFEKKVRLPRKLAHAYWEFRAERWVPDQYWMELENLISQDYTDSELLFEDTVRRTVVPFPINWAVTKSVLKVSTLRSWRHLTNVYVHLSRFDLHDQDLAPYIELCLERMRDSLLEGPPSEEIMRLDPTGVFPEHHGC